MPYSTVEQLFISYPRFSGTGANSATVVEYLNRSSSFIDAYIAPVVPTVPVTPAPPLLQTLCMDLSFVWFMRRNITEASKQPYIERLWLNSIQILERIRSGYLSLVDANGNTLNTNAGGYVPWSSVSGYTPTFGLDDIMDVENDPDRIYDEEISR